LAAAYVLLHEIHHIMLRSDGSAPGGWEEELMCDAFASRFLLSDVVKHATDTTQSAPRILNKRAMGVALANSVIVELTPASLWGGSGHPPVADRLRANYASWPDDEHASVWVYMACLLVARLRRESRTLQAIAFQMPRSLCESLTRLMS
jgi:hypothetical protein